MSNFTKVFLMIVGILVVLALLAVGAFYVITLSIQRTAEQAFSPLIEANSSIETQVAQILNPTPTIIPNPATIIHEVRSLARLETIQYTLEKVITAEQGQDQLGFLFGDRLLFVGHGTVIAGVDLARMRPEDMWVEGQVLYVRLPPAEIFVVDLDNEKSYVYDRDTGLLNRGNIDLERSARQAAEKEIYNAALDDGILEQAQQNAEAYMSRMLRGLGYQDVIFVEATPQPDPEE
ncbi:MAG: DUF4230 domain-containing protein [Chloroflexi bacterium]|nr:DUF4230 domain-containing protein [Chloroflexota bacterium]